MLTSKQRKIALLQDAEVAPFVRRMIERALDGLAQQLKAGGDPDADLLFRPRVRQALIDVALEPGTRKLQRLRDKWRAQLPSAQDRPMSLDDDAVMQGLQEAELTEEEARRILREVVPIYLRYLAEQGLSP